MQLSIPELALIIIIGANYEENQKFIHKHFLAEELPIQQQTDDMYVHILKRIGSRKLCVIDGSRLDKALRTSFVKAARELYCPAVAIVFECSGLVPSIKNEGFRIIYRFNATAQVNDCTLTRTALRVDQRQEGGPFDIIGDVHGCCDELEELLHQLGYAVKASSTDSSSGPLYVHPENRRAVFVGDFVDRGPRSADVLKLVGKMAQHGSALCVLGNHDIKLLRKLQGKDVQVGDDLADTLAEFDQINLNDRDEFNRTVQIFLEGLTSHLVLDSGNLVVAHAGIKEDMHGRESNGIQSFCLYGDVTGETDEYGLPIRLNWAADYQGAAMVVYGHTPVAKCEWLNNTINIDTGCAYGGKLTALRYPEKELVQVKAKQQYSKSRRPIDFEG